MEFLRRGGRPIGVQNMECSPQPLFSSVEDDKGSVNAAVRGYGFAPVLPLTRLVESGVTGAAGKHGQGLFKRERCLYRIAM